STLITVFRYYSNWRVIRDMNSECNQLKQLDREQHQIVERIYREGDTVRESVDTAGLDEDLFERRMGRWEGQYHELMMYVTSASLVVKRLSLWISVILGVLLVLIGVVVSVRANKSLKRWEQVLNEQQILLYEIHHRVKNNLAVISGFLELESMQGGDPQKALQESRYRIRTMAMIHEILYQSKTFSEVRMDQYLEKLSTDLCTSRIEQCSDISVTTDLEVVTLNINQAVPAGMLINELLSLVIEEAASSIEQSRVVVRLREKDENVLISCSIDAVEHLTKQSLMKSSTARQTILNALLMQLKADFQIRHKERTVLEVQFEKSSRPGSSSRYM
ncbi:MAG: sensor histidine kinase, partial [Balneolaceae bacterium]